MEKALLGYTHDPQTGEWLPRVNAPDHPKAAALQALLNTHHFTDAVEVTLQGETKIKAAPMSRSARAAIKIAASLLRLKRIEPATAIGRVPLNQFLSLIGKRLAPVQPTALAKIGGGLGAAVGAAAGRVAFTSEQAVELSAAGPVVLLVEKTTPEDMAALQVVQAIVTRIGGYTSHAAVVARQMGKPCIVDAKFTAEPTVNEMVTVDATSGTILLGEAAFEEGKVDDDMLEILAAADAAARMRTLANADTPEDVALAIKNGAVGVGLCRTEHTFFSEEGTAVIRKMILATSPSSKKVAIQALENLQRIHFRDFFKALGARPATVRLLDPPLHEFLPDLDKKEDIKALAKSMKLSIKALTERIHQLQEENPMLGHRGCRLGITMDGLYEAQARAIVGATTDVGYTGALDIMVPLVADKKELSTLVDSLRKTVSATLAGNFLGGGPKVSFGTMIETPRACIVADQLAEVCDFFSFGTNDLTQATWALSRDDSASFLAEYAARGILQDPFVVLDFDGVGALMGHAVEIARAKKPGFKIGICGEHGGDPRSIAFCHSLGLDYISCSPPRLLVARLAAGHANVKPDQPTGIEELDLEPPKIEEVVAAPVAPKAQPINLMDLPLVVTAPSGPVHTVVELAALLPPPKIFPAPPVPGGAYVVNKTFGTATIVANKPVASGKSIFVIDTETAIAHAVKPTNQKVLPDHLAKTIAAYSGPDPKKLEAGAKALFGMKVKPVKVDGTSPGPGVVQGYVTSPFLSLIVLTLDDAKAGGHDGKQLKAHIKWLGSKPSDLQLKNLWFSPLNELKVP